MSEERRQPTSVLVVVAAVFLLVAGSLSLATGAIFGVVGGLVAGLEDVSGAGTGLFGATGGAVVAYGVAVVTWGILEIFAAAAMIAHRGWGRVLGLAVGAIGLAFTGLSLAGALGGGEPLASTGIDLVLVAGYGLTVLALATGGGHFRGAGRSAPGS
ncbi:MAG: hypothetical protein ABIG85_07675 [Chloroflexota bacterium]